MKDASAYRGLLGQLVASPFADQDALTQTKNDLERAGIKNFVRRY